MTSPDGKVTPNIGFIDSSFRYLQDLLNGNTPGLAAPTQEGAIG